MKQPKPKRIVHSSAERSTSGSAQREAGEEKHRDSQKPDGQRGGE